MVGRNAEGIKMKRTLLEPIFLTGKMGFIFLSLFLTQPGITKASGLSDLGQIGLAFVTSIAVHESGHALIADQVGNAEEVNMQFFTKRGNSFSLGVTEVKNLNQKSKIPFIMGGEIASSYNFEFALVMYRQKPTIFNRSLMFFSGTDFLLYTVYSLYLNKGASHQDPVALKKETGVSEEAILGLALTQTLLNYYRISSGKDRVIPYLAFDDTSVKFMARITTW